MAIPPDSELDRMVLERLALYGVDISVLPVTATDPNPYGASTQAQTIAACRDALKLNPKVLAYADDAEPVMWSTTQLAIEEDHGAL